jgi:hypothetical protein
VINLTPFVEFINKHGFGGGKNEGHYCSIINTNQTIIKPCLNKRNSMEVLVCKQVKQVGGHKLLLV